MTETATKAPRLTANKRTMIANELVALESELMNRQRLATSLGRQYDGNRELYKVLGYKDIPTIDDYFGMYRRNEIAKGVINAPVAASWETFPEIEESDDTDTTFEKQADEFVSDFGLQQVFSQLDILSSIGTYAVLLIGVRDGLSLDQPLTRKKSQLLYLRPYGQPAVSIADREGNSQSPRFGLPTAYEISMSAGSGVSQSTTKRRVHFSRVIHVAQECLTNPIEGTPQLEVIFNRLQDIEKVVGGDAEAFWRTAEPTIVANLDPTVVFSPENDGPKWEEKILDMIHRLKKFLILQGTKVEQLQPEISDPAGHFSMLVDMVAAGKRIPKRILLGSELGELASTADKIHWFRQIKARREQFCEPVIIRPFFDKLIEQQIITKPKDGYNIKWDDMLTPSDKEKAEVGKLIADALAAYSNSGAEGLVPRDRFIAKLGFTAEEIDQIKQETEDAAGDNLDPTLDTPPTDPPANPQADPTQGDGDDNQE